METSQRKATRSFFRNMGTVFQKVVSQFIFTLSILNLHQAERVAKQTNAWIFVGMQHPHSRTHPYLYVSPSLSRDGGPHAADVCTDFASLTHNMIKARQHENTDLRQELDKLKRELEEERHRSQIGELQAELEATRRELVEYRRQGDNRR
jgi:hypothetical protein